MKSSLNNSTISVELEILRQYRGKALWTALAVLIDGEGCIGLAKHEDRNSQINAHVTVGNTAIEWMNAWRDRVDRGRMFPYKGRTPQQKDHTFWKITKRADIVYILKKILPYLIVKRQQAIEVLSFFQDKLSHKQTWLGEQELARREAIYQRMRNLNRKGPSESVETKRRASQVEDVIVPSMELPIGLGANDLVN